MCVYKSMHSRASECVWNIVWMELLGQPPGLALFSTLFKTGSSFPVVPAKLADQNFQDHPDSASCLLVVMFQDSKHLFFCVQLSK